MTVFTTVDLATWPIVLSAAQVAAIYQRSKLGLERACASGTFVPAPFQRRPRYLWRRSDVLRHVDGAASAFRKIS